MENYLTEVSTNTDVSNKQVTAAVLDDAGYSTFTSSEERTFLDYYFIFKPTSITY